jgi:hypothetical protein
MQRVVIIVYIMMEMNNMFNVEKSLKKLDEIYDKSIIPSPVIKHIREILLAGQADGVEEKTYAHKSIIEQEARRRLEMIEERLAKLEAWMDSNEVCLETTPDGTEKPVTEEKYKHQEFKNEPFVGILDTNPEKTVTDALSIGHLSDIGAFKQKGAKLKPVTEENTCYCYESGTCSYCRNKKYDKPSEFISLPRWVAERYIRYVEAKDTPEAIEYYRSRQDVIDAIKQQLG